MRALAAFLILSAVPAYSQKLNPVQWTLTVEPAAAAPGAKVLARLTAKLEAGWHLYSLAAPSPIIPTSIRMEDSPAVKFQDIYQPKPMRKFDQNFNMEVETYESEAVFFIEGKVADAAPAGTVQLTAAVRFQCCNDKLCLPPKRVTAPASLKIDPAAAKTEPAIPPGYTRAALAAPQSVPPKNPPPPSPASTASQEPLVPFLLVAFGFGLAAIFTPCVFPMIPITVSFFLNKPEGARRQTITEALLFCGGIVVLFTGLGLLASAILGPFGIVQLGSNPWVNGFIALVFLVFALSLLGAFEITIPSTVLTRLDQASQKGGILGNLLMGLTFSLTAFACVGPFVGTLLAASVQSGHIRPALGMISFASGLALPFFVLALFPAYLKRLPKSGGWLARVKVVMGFVILAAMFKYLSAVDQVFQWNVLTRERFLAIWIVLFSMAGLYLLGFLRLSGIKPDEEVGLGRLLVGTALLAFSISLVPGMFGARLGELDAYVPLPSNAGGAAQSGGLVWMQNQYRQALDKARQENKRVLVAFTGYACTNCHWMKANMFTRPEVAAVMRDFVLVELYTDGNDPASGENQKLQESRFATVAIPFYAILDANEKVIASSAGLTRNPAEFLGFLKTS